LRPLPGMEQLLAAHLVRDQARNRGRLSSDIISPR
jgi:hypothetical protein